MLSYATVSAPGATPARAAFVLHGILGSKTNWRTLARRITAEDPSWALVLVDLRLHGASQGMAPPHTLAAAARDLDDLAATLPLPVHGVVGHSFGGKVALAFARDRAAVSHLVVVDSNPGARPDRGGSEASLAALETLSSMGPTWERREDFLAAVLAAGHGRDIAAWLAMNLEHAERGFRLRLDVAAIRTLLDDYFVQDLWDVLESPPPGRRATVVLGARSPVLDVAELERLERLQARRLLHLDVIADAGHWVHVDQPDATVDAVVRGLGPA